MLRQLTLLPLLLMVLLSHNVQAENFEVTGAKVTLKDGLYLADISLSFPLNSELKEALHSGVTIPIKVILEVYLPRNYLLEGDIAFLKQRYDLDYHALSRQYIVTNHNSAVVSSFSTLSAALEELGSIRNLPIIDQDILEPGKSYHLRIRTAIDTNAISIPLRLISYFSGPWRNNSEWWDMPL